MDALTQAWFAVRYSFRFMAWNLFLAIIPLILALWLFRGKKSRSPLWWLGLVLFIAFLPNAPYVLTDSIHGWEVLQQQNSLWILGGLVIPQYALFISLGFGAYVLSLIYVGDYLQRWGWGQKRTAAELFLHAVTAVGIYWGRFERLNSWDFLAQPGVVLQTAIANFTQFQFIAAWAIAFGVLLVLYTLVKQLAMRLWQSFNDSVRSI
ncbi:MAG: DUF1361 domain-containing protein [Jaaginema sp. PMC 1079.18]|nr:DUF1361 domain-containing protein [Jaaginema sp. PMC 1080.18]MEC4851725.1 DUF1361 domain-containing protein [Jaaginema sp. PMC 1079.18]MEC4865804.1 DUF1361 domain-containing protein [Jaaginema sp. PMC 1078.18]